MKVPELNWSRNTLFKLLLISFGIFIAIVLIVLAFKTPRGVSPDEDYHLHFALYYLENSLDPFFKQDSHYQLGDISRTGSYLYAYLGSYILRAFTFVQNQVLLLRISNVIVSILNLILMIFLSRNILKRKAGVLGALLLLYSFLMYTFLGAFINYDNLLITASLLLLIAYLILLQKPSLNYFILFISIGLIGSLVKVSLLPLFEIVALLALIQLFLKYYKKRSVKDIDISSNTMLFMIILLFSLILFVERYGVNIYQYETLVPECDQVHQLDSCLENAVFERDYNFINENQEEPRLSLLSYSKPWASGMYQGLVGIMSHRYFPPWQYASLFLIPIFSVSFIGAGYLVYKRRYRELKIDLVIIIISYALLLMLGFNYPTYQSTGVINLALQGRYLFPVLPLVAIMLVYYALKILRGKLIYPYLIFLFIYFLIQYYYLFNNIGVLWE